MNKMLLLIAVGGLIAIGAALNYHFILMDNHDIKVLKKITLTFDKTFVDARGSKRLTLILDPSLVRAGVKDLIREAGK